MIYIGRVDLGAGRSLHLIAINDCYYVHSTEVSQLLWEDDIIKAKVCRQLCFQEVFFYSSTMLHYAAFIFCAHLLKLIRGITNLLVIINVCGKGITRYIFLTVINLVNQSCTVFIADFNLLRFIDESDGSIFK